MKLGVGNELVCLGESFRLPIPSLLHNDTYKKASFHLHPHQIGQYKDLHLIDRSNTNGCGPDSLPVYRIDYFGFYLLFIGIVHFILLVTFLLMKLRRLRRMEYLRFTNSKEESHAYIENGE